MKKRSISILLFACAFVLALALPVLPSLLNNDGFYGMAVNEPGEPVPGYQPPAGAVTVIFFGYRYCGTVCPLQLVNLMDLSRRLKDVQVRFLFITLDPENDSPAALQQAMAELGEAFRAYRPDSHLAARKLASAYHDVAYESNGPPGEKIAHSANLHVVTSDFHRKLIYTTPDLDLDLVEQDLRRILNDNRSQSST